MNDENEAHLKSIVGSLIQAMETLTGTVDQLADGVQVLTRRIEILELRLDIEEPKE